VRFFFLRKEAYQKIGGHLSVANEVLEDIMIAKKAKLNGLSILVADGKNLFSIRMYHSMREIWMGWRKNIFLAMKSSVFRASYYMAMVLCFSLDTLYCRHVQFVGRCRERVGRYFASRPCVDFSHGTGTLS